MINEIKNLFIREDTYRSLTTKEVRRFFIGFGLFIQLETHYYEYKCVELSSATNTLASKNLGQVEIYEWVKLKHL